MDELHQLIQDLQAEDLWTQSAAAHKLQTRAIELAEFVPHLQAISASRDYRMGYKATWLLKSLGKETTARWGNKPFSILCPDCFVNFRSYKVRLTRSAMLDYEDNDSTIVYYACSKCGKSREYLDTEGSIVVLDNRMKERYTQNDDIVHINWLMFQQLFYFSEVEIVRVLDEEVERFVVQLGNDTDEERKERNKEARCLIASDCGLSENTRRILEYFFDRVEIVEGFSWQGAI